MYNSKQSIANFIKNLSEKKTKTCTIGFNFIFLQYSIFYISINNIFDKYQ